MVIQFVRWLYAILLWLYPPAFRAQFSTEMQHVFAQVLADATQQGPRFVFAACLRELGSVCMGSFVARGHALRAAIWGGGTPPDTFVPQTIVQRLVLLLAALGISGLVSICAARLLLDAVVPQTSTAAIERIRIGEWRSRRDSDYVYLIADTLSCTTTPPTATQAMNICTTTFEGQQLQVAVTFNDHQRNTLDPSACEARYGAEVLACEAGYFYGYGRMSTAVTIPNLLGVSPARIAQLRQEQPLVYWHENDWIALSTALALIAVALGLVVLWRWSRIQVAPLLTQGGYRMLLGRTGQVVICLGSSVLLFGWMWYGLLFMLMTLGLAD